MAIEIMTAAWKVKGLTPIQKLILLDLADTANEAGVSWPSVDRIAGRTGASRASVFRAFAELEERKLIERDPRHNRSTVYTVTLGGSHGETSTSQPETPGVSQCDVQGSHSETQNRQGNRQQEPSLNQKAVRTRETAAALSAVPGLDLDAMTKWLDYRRQIKKPFASSETVMAQARKLAGFGVHQAAVVQQSIDEGWQGLFALKKAPAPAVPDRLWDPERETFVDTKNLKPWEIEKLQRAAKAQDSFAMGAINA